MKQCDTCIFGNKSEYEKPCIVYKGENCEVYKKRGDDMTRDEAIMVLKNEQPHCGKKALFPEEKKYEAYNVAIKALENISHITDRPCDVCEFHTEQGCTQWKCVFCDELFGSMR